MRRIHLPILLLILCAASVFCGCSADATLNRAESEEQEKAIAEIEKLKVGNIGEM